MQIRRIGRYQLLEIVGKGGQGTVYRGHDPSTGQIVAVKILAEAHSDGDFLERFQREASILASLEHPHVIKVFDHGEEEGRHYIVTEYVPENLARIIEQGDPLPTRRALTVAAQIASALAVTHENGVTHRDVKPANVLISDSGDVKLTDFGIATADVMNTVSTPDSTVGTPLYMSPEQIQSRDIDGRSDIYSLGCLLYQILTGNPPFQGESAYDIFNAHMNGEYEPLSSVIESCPEELDNLLSKALATSVNDRFQSADELMDAIDEVADQLTDTGDQTLATRVMPRTIRSLSKRNPIWKRRNTWVTGVAAVAVLAIVGFAASTMLGGGSAVGLATGVTDTTESSLVPQAPIIIPEEPELAADLPIAENVLFSYGPNPDYVYAQISLPAVADVGHLSNISASTRDLDGNEAKLNVASVKTDGLRAPLNVIFLRAMEITVDAGEVVTDTLPGIIEFQVKRQWIEESGIQKNDIGLYRFKDEWQILPTIHEGSFIGSEDLFYERFSATTPGFSRFAIGLTLQTQDAQSIAPDSSKETASPQQPPADSPIQPSKPQSANEFPAATPLTPTPLALVGLQTTEVPTPEPMPTQSVPTPILAAVTPQTSVEALPTQEPLPTATPIPPTQVPTPTRVPPTSTPTPSPTPVLAEKVKDGSLIQLSTTQQAHIEYPGDVDEWIYVPSSSMIGKSVNISGITDNPDSDGYLEFLSPSGDVVGEDDDSGLNMNPVISNALLSESGVYTIRFMLLDGTSGGYTLQIEPADSNLLTPTVTLTPTPTPTPTPTITPIPPISHTVYFKDSNLEEAVRNSLRNTIGTAPDEITYGDMAELTNLDAYAASTGAITSLVGLEFATNLESLYLDNNSISDLGPISSLTNLRWVEFWGNNISDLGPLSGLTNLESLGLGENSISDIGPISSLTNLEYLYMDQNSISDLSTISSLTNLRWVGFRNNNISNLDPLAGLSNLNSLDLYQNEISNLEPLQSLTSLTYLEISDNPISDYSPITELCNATNTYCQGVPGIYFEDPDLEVAVRNSLSNALGTAPDKITYGNIAQLTVLDAYTLSEGSITSLVGLEYATNLESLYLYNQSITDLGPLSGLTNLESLYLDENPISDLGPISSLTNLRWVGFWDTNISDLGPLSGLTTLESLSLGGNSISDLSPISSLTNLESLYLDENSISDLSPTSALTNLRWVGFRNNNISNLDPLAALSNLNSLDLYQNEISNLAALQSLTSLTYLEIGENPITDYSPITELCNATNTYCSGVPVLTQTTVSYPTDLTVADLAGGGYGGNYQMNGSYNGRPVWTNPLGGDTGYEPRHIFFSPQQVVSSNGTWVIQSGSPTDEWDAGGYYDCQGLPWEECSPGWEGFKLDVTVEASTAWQEWQDSP